MDIFSTKFIIFFSFGLIIFNWLFLYFLIPKLRKTMIDIPNERSSHVRPIPTGGGIGFVLSSTFTMLIYKDIICLICIPLSIIGLLDDKYKVSSLVRFLSQLFTVLILLLISPFFMEIMTERIFFTTCLFFIFILIFGSALINFINFMDGIDGLVAGCILVFIASIAFILNSYIFLISASLIGFLVWNWNPAKVFMGDTGSTFLGSISIGYLLQITDLQNLFGCILVLFPLLADCIICLAIRLFYRQNIFKPHKLHLYQRLNQGGLNQRIIVIIYISASLISSFIFLNYNLIFQLSYSLIILVIGFYLNKKYAIKFSSKIN